MWARHHGSLQAYAGPSGVLPGVLPQPESRRAVDRGSRINSQPTYRGHLGAQRPLHPSVHSCGCHSAGLEVQSAARNSAGRFMVRTPDVAPQFQTGGENGLSHSFRWRELRGWGRRCSPALDPIRAAGLIQRGRAGEHRLPHLRVGLIPNSTTSGVLRLIPQPPATSQLAGNGDLGSWRIRKRRVPSARESGYRRPLGTFWRLADESKSRGPHCQRASSQGLLGIHFDILHSSWTGMG